MTGFTFEGEINSLSERQIKFVSDVLEERGFSDETVVIETVGKVDDNYVANVRRFTIEKNEETFKMVAKIAPTNATLRTAMGAKFLFNNEHLMYTQVLPKFAEMEIEADLPLHERLRFATCYGTLLEEPNEIILLEDLKVSDYVIFDKHKSLTDDSVKLILRNFAILHALSYALKDREPETYESLKIQLYNSWATLPDSEDMKLYFKQLEEGLLDILDNDDYKKATTGSMSRAMDLIRENLTFDKESKYSVIQQGDAWTNNLMFKLKDEKPTDCCMIDYQLSNHNSPVADLHYMIFNCTDYETRSKHYHEWIDYYHTELDRCLSHFDLKTNLVYPRDQLDADLRRLAKIYFAISIMVASSLMRETNEAATLKEAMQKDDAMTEIMNASSLTTMAPISKMRFKSRVDGLIASFIELRYIHITDLVRKTQILNVAQSTP